MGEFVTGRDTTAEQLLWFLNGQQPLPAGQSRQRADQRPVRQAVPADLNHGTCGRNGS